MLALAGNILIGLVLGGTVAAGGALFWIARQDGSPQGKTLGILLLIAAALTSAYLIIGDHWL
jgi:hypothetical protein